MKCWRCKKQVAEHITVKTDGRYTEMTVTSGVTVIVRNKRNTGHYYHRKCVPPIEWNKLVRTHPGYGAVIPEKSA